MTRGERAEGTGWTGRRKAKFGVSPLSGHWLVDLKESRLKAGRFPGVADRRCLRIWLSRPGRALWLPDPRAAREER